MNKHTKRVFFFGDMEARHPLQTMQFLAHPGSEPFLGVFTDELSDGGSPVSPDIRSGVDEVNRLGMVSALQKCLADSDVLEKSDLHSWDADAIFAGFLSLEPRRATVVIDDQSCAAQVVVYGGLEFCFGYPFVDFPFLMVRQFGSADLWPTLLSYPIDT